MSKKFNPWLIGLFCASIAMNLVYFNSLLKKYRSTFYDSSNIKYTCDRESIYRLLPVNKSDFVFLGDSEIQKFDLSEFLGKDNLKNRGIDGDVSIGVYHRLDDVIKGQPQKIFLEIGTNDIKRHISLDTTLSYIQKIITRTKQVSPATQIIINSVLPTNLVKSEAVVNLNNGLKNICKTSDISFVDTFSKFNVKGKLNPLYDCGDGLHLNGRGYMLWASILKPYL